MLNISCIGKKFFTFLFYMKFQGCVFLRIDLALGIDHVQRYVMKKSYG